MMTPERWAKTEELFQAALDCAPNERAKFVAENCGDDQELFRAVEKLVRDYDASDSFLESPIWRDSQSLQTTLKNKIASSFDSEIFMGEDGDAFAHETIDA